MNGRARSPMLVLLVVSLVPALVLGGIWQLAEMRAEQGIPPELPEYTPPRISGTPVLSVRRAPATLAIEAALPALSFQLDPVVNQVGGSTCLAVSVEGRPVSARNEQFPLLPASNMKLITGAVALDVIGPDYRYTTELRGRVVGEVIEGNLYFVGGGDPLLAVESYPDTQRYPPLPRTPVESLVDTLVAAGVTSVTGAVIGVDTRYDAERFVDSWSEGVRVTEAGPLGALLVNDGFVTGQSQKPEDPGVAAAIELTRLLLQAGITVGAFPISGAVGVDAPVIASVESAPFAEVLAQMLTSSDNNTAELMLKEIAVQSNRSGTRADGLVVLNERLTEWGIPTEGLVLVDGSGLDRNNRLTCQALLALLHRVDLDGPFGTGMAVAGEPGTMSGFFDGTPLDGALRAKTGTLTGAKAFSGYLVASGGVTLTFSLIMNGDVNAQCGQTQCPLFEALARALATYPGGAPDAALLAPTP